MKALSLVLLFSVIYSGVSIGNAAAQSVQPPAAQDVITPPNPEYEIGTLANLLKRGVPLDPNREYIPIANGVIWRVPVDWDGSVRLTLMAIYGQTNSIFVAIPIEDNDASRAVRAGIVAASDAITWMNSSDGENQIAAAAKQRGTMVFQNVGNPGPTAFTSPLRLSFIVPPIEGAYNQPSVPLVPSPNGEPVVARIVTGRLAKYVRIQSAILVKYDELVVLGENGNEIGFATGWDGSGNEIRSLLPFQLSDIEAAAAQMRQIASMYPFLLGQARIRAAGTPTATPNVIDLK